METGEAYPLPMRRDLASLTRVLRATRDPAMSTTETSGRFLSGVAIWIAAIVSTAGAAPVPIALDPLLAAVSSRVEAYYARAQSIICTETVRLQPIESDWMPRELGRTLVYDLRVEWDRAVAGEAPPEPVIVRQLRTVNGRVPKPTEEPKCMDPKPVSPDSLSMLLPLHRSDYVFKLAGTGRVDKRTAMMIDYKARSAGPADIKWNGDCVSIDLPGRYRGRVWVDADSDDVLRVDEELVGFFEFPVPKDHSHPGGPKSMLVENATSSTRYRAVRFTDPDETLVLPASIESLQVIRNAGVPRLRVIQTFTEYRRFLTGGRVVKPGS